GRGSVIFSVNVENQEVFKSPIMHGGEDGIPLSVELSGVRDFFLNVSDAGDGIACDQADWADAKVILEDGREIWLGDMPLVDEQEEPPDTAPFFSFVYNGKPSLELLNRWEMKRESEEINGKRMKRILVWNDPKTLLEIRCEAVEYKDFPAIEWTLYFKNNGQKDTPILSDIRSLDVRFERCGNNEFILHHNKGTFVRADDFEPLSTVLLPDARHRFAPPGGRPCGHVFPYFNLEKPGGGVIIVVGWPGQWAAEFQRDGGNGLAVRAGQELTHLKLHPGEEIRAPLMLLQFWQGDYIRSQNIWRRWMREWGMPKPGGKPIEPLNPACSSHQYREMIDASEENQKMFIDRYLEEGLKIDYWWMDAGWYVNKTGWPNTGTWEVDKTRFPNGLRAICDHAHAKGVKSLVWFEPERVTPGTWLSETHPEWLLQGTILNLGNPEAWNWLVNHIDKILVEEAIDLYRQDYNIDPLSFWRAADSEDRKGITENHYITGYLSYWDELLRRHPGMLIDSCASGGHRNDMETMRRSLPFLRSDFLHHAAGNQGHTYGLSFWLPYHGTGSSQTGKYDLRSAMSGTHFISVWDMRNRDLDYNLFRKLISDWRITSMFTLRGDYYPLTRYSLKEDVWMAWQFHRQDTDAGVIQAFRRRESASFGCQFRLYGIDPDASYRARNLDQDGDGEIISGAALMNQGLRIVIDEKPGSAIIVYKKEPVKPNR
ncbi:alpha-galactosidase, partial [Candidatus Sumerlaeota bacterium]|nr:alpha-galactosidase [Candidatus Sumerlaeota bacterium]